MLRRMMMAGGGGLATDPYFSYVSSLIHFEGPPGGNSFADEKGNSLSILGSGALSSAWSRFGSTSYGFVPSSGVVVLGTSVIDLSQDFTIEFFPKVTSDGSGLRCFAHFYYNAGSNNGLNIYRNSSSGVLQVDNGLAAITPGTIAIPLNSTPHIAVVRDSGTIRGYVDGVQCLSHSAQSYPATIDRSSIGLFKGNLYPMNGYIDEWRVTKGYCRYPGGTTFTPPSSAFPNS